MEIKSTSNNGIQALIKEEGLVLHPYLDDAGIATIGGGMTFYPDTGKKVTMLDKKLSIEQAIYYLHLIVKPFELSVYSLTRDDINQNQFDAQLMIAYNIGTGAYKKSNLVKDVNRYADANQIIIDFCSWRYVTVKGKGKVPLLLPRRKREAALYNKPIITVPALSSAEMMINQVKHIQTKLGFSLANTDGSYGPTTKAAVKAFQIKHGLTDDGIVGPNTLLVLNAE